MNDDNLEKYSERKVEGKNIIAPIIAIAALILIAGGVSYAYFGIDQGTIANANINVTTPAYTNKIVNINKTDCSIDVSMDKMLAGEVNTTAKYSGSCSITISINGTAGDSCTYNVALENGTCAYTKSGPLGSGVFEYSGALSGAASTPTSGAHPDGQYQMDDLAGTGTSSLRTLIGSQTITVATSGTMETNTYTLTTKFYNINQDQSALITNCPTGKYKHSLKIVDLSCNWNH